MLCSPIENEVLLADYDVPNMLKFPVLAASTILITFSLTEFVLRRTPGLRSVL
ncbi:MAG TPA: hypothetical protein VGB78_04115 [Thermoplasmata archaeon]